MRRSKPVKAGIVLEQLRENQGLLKKNLQSLELVELTNVQPPFCHTGVLFDGTEIVGVGKTKEESLEKLHDRLHDYFRHKKQVVAKTTIQTKTLFV